MRGTGAVASAAVLAILLSENGVSAAPASLLASGKIALVAAGGAASGSASFAAVPGKLTGKILLAVFALTAIGGATYHVLTARNAQAASTAAPASDCSVPTAAHLSRAPTAESVAAALRKQDAVSIDVRLTREWTKIETGERSADDDHYIRSGSVVRLDRCTGNGKEQSSSYDSDTDETRVLYRGADGSLDGAVFDGLRFPFDVNDVWETGRYFIFPSFHREGFLFEQIERGIVSPKTETVDGSACWRVDIPYDEGQLGFDKCTVWVDPSIGFCPRRIVFPYSGRQATVVTFKDYRGYGDGIWLPGEQTITFQVPIENDHCVLVNRVVSATVGHHVSKHELKITFPPGTRMVK